MIENSLIEKKSILGFLKKNPDWDELAKDCVCFANAQGDHIYVGIEDSDSQPPENQKIPNDLTAKILKQIQNRTISVNITASVIESDNKSEYIEINIQRSLSSIASTTNGRYYLRVNDVCKPVLPDELTRLMNDRQAYNWETQQLQKISRKDYDIEKFEQFKKDIIKSSRISNFVKSKTDDELIDYYFFAIGDYLTNLGILWIGKRHDRANLLYSPTVQYIKYDELDRKVNKIVWDEFSMNPKELLQSVWESIPEFKESLEYPDGIFRKNIYNYDEVVVRELLVNALVHRPYTTRGDIFINLYLDRLEIHNPGLLPLGVSPENILHTSVQRNPLLSKVFFDLMLMEKEGSGYDTIYEVLLTNGKNVPVVEEKNDRVVVTVRKNIVNQEVINFIDKINKKYNLKSKELIALGLIAQKKSTSLKDISKIIGQDTKTIQHEWMYGLIEHGIILFEDKTTELIYYINPSINI